MKRLASVLGRRHLQTTAALLPHESGPPPPPARLPRESKPQLALTPSHPSAPIPLSQLNSPWPLSDGPPLRPPLLLRQPCTHYRLHTAAYGIPKHPSHPANSLEFAVQVGEDAYFIRGNALGVADGVGGWSKRAPLPVLPSPSALFARRLMHYTAAEFTGEHNRMDVVAVLERAYNQTVKAHTTPTGSPLHCGSSTALVAYLSDSPPAVHLAHVGDCMGMVVRNTEIVWRTDEMWWAWNTPVQLSPPALPFCPTPRTTARIFTVPVLPGDILILASDGLSDNLWDEDVLDEIARFRQTWACPADSHLRRSTMAGMLSEALCSRARSVSERKENETPFARRARQVGKQFTGGKRDDISVLVAIVAPR